MKNKININSDKKYKNFVKKIKKSIPQKNILNDPLSTHAYANDASHYYYLPKVVVIVENEEQVKTVLKISNELNVPISIRAGGSSLSGQSVTDSVLVVLSWQWKDYTIYENGDSIRLQAGVVGNHANHYLKPFKKTIGPDPSSIQFAKIGGIAANNSSGMCCGIQNNSYNTLKAIRVIFSNGTVLDTGNKQSIQEFKIKHEAWLLKIQEIRNLILKNDNLKNKIIKKYRIKNTVGYSLNSFIDFEDPIDILAHLMIGSEGTLGFISDITYKTIEDHPLKKVSIYFFKDIKHASIAIQKIDKSYPTAIEFLDGESLDSAYKKLSHFYPKDFDKEKTCALLIDVRAENDVYLNNKILNIESSLSDCTGITFHTEFYEGEKYNLIWKIRKEIAPLVQAQRQEGSLILLEDVAYPLEVFPEATEELQGLFKKYNFQRSCLFGHARDGNLHFLIEVNFQSEKDIKKYQDFMEDLALIIVRKYNGSLKAEHGTGRNVAPFVELEWGQEAYEMMLDIKYLLDPNMIMNPDVLLSKDSLIHIKNLKLVPTLSPLLDKCVECGACERVCPSTNLTLTPRQRIVALRAMEKVKVANPNSYQIMKKDFKYRGSDTCAASGMCGVICPVGVDTGVVIKKWRSEQQNFVTNSFWKWVSHFHFIVKPVTKFALKLIKKI